MHASSTHENNLFFNPTSLESVNKSGQLNLAILRHHNTASVESLTINDLKAPDLLSSPASLGILHKALHESLLFEETIALRSVDQRLTLQELGDSRIILGFADGGLDVKILDLGEVARLADQLAKDVVSVLSLLPVKSTRFLSALDSTSENRLAVDMEDLRFFAVWVLVDVDGHFGEGESLARDPTHSLLRIVSGVYCGFRFMYLDKGVVRCFGVVTLWVSLNFELGLRGFIPEREQGLSGWTKRTPVMNELEDHGVCESFIVPLPIHR